MSTPEESKSIVGWVSEKYAKYPAVKALANLIPYWGSADALLAARAEALRKDRLFEFFDNLASGKEVITEQLIEDNEFLHCYFRTLKSVLDTQRKEKIRLFANLLKSDARGEVQDTDEFEEMLSSLDQISFREFEILKRLEERRVYLRELNLSSQGHPQDWHMFMESLAAEYGMTRTDFLGYLTRLQRTGFFRLESVVIGGKDMGHTTDLFTKFLAYVVEVAEKAGP